MKSPTNSFPKLEPDKSAKSPNVTKKEDGVHNSKNIMKIANDASTTQDSASSPSISRNRPSPALKPKPAPPIAPKPRPKSMLDGQNSGENRAS